MTRVLIVDDQRLFAEALDSALTQAGVEVVGIAVSGARALELLEEQVVDVVLLDICLPDRHGSDVAAQILRSHPGIKVLALSGTDDPGVIKDLQRIGVHAFLPKRTRLQQIVNTIEATDESELWPETVAARPRRDIPGIVNTTLTERERQVLGLLSEGATGGEIAERLNIAPNTVRSHVQNILDKLQVHSRLEAVALAARGDSRGRTALMQTT